MEGRGGCVLAGIRVCGVARWTVAGRGQFRIGVPLSASDGSSGRLGVLGRRWGVRSRMAVTPTGLRSAHSLRVAAVGMGDGVRRPWDMVSRHGCGSAMKPP